jgi:protein TonB
MDQFLNELAVEARPKTGYELAQRALAQARQMGRAQDDGEEDPAGTPKRNGQAIEPFSWERYFDAFVRKLNRSAAFVERAPGSREARATRKALVRISLNADGSLKSYRVLRAADRDAELDYIRRVVEQASPFSAFPPDIRSATDSLTIFLCVFPPREGGGSGFARSFGGEDCRG